MHILKYYKREYRRDVLFCVIVAYGFDITKMGQKYLIVSFFLFVILFVADGSEVPFIKKCKAADSKCLKENAERAIPIFAAGLPNLNVECLDPMTIDRIDASTPNLKLIITDITTTGLKNCAVKKIKRDIVKSKIYMKIECTLEVNGHYDMSGQILILPIEGHGKAKVILRKAVFAADCDIENIKRSDGKIHWHIKDWRHTFELKEKSTLVFENLFNGNKVLAQAANELIDSSPNEVILEIGNPIIEFMIKKVMDNIEHMYKIVPGEDLALD